MSVICEECGKIYHIPPEKLKELKEKNGKIKCKVCGFIIPFPEIKEPKADLLKEKKVHRIKKDEKGEDTYSLPVKGMGLRSKMFFLFLVIPLALMTGSGFFSYTQLQTLSSNIIEESTQAVQILAEDKIANKAESVALQCRIFLLNRPDITKDDFNYDMDFKKISVQKVGLTGYTALFEISGQQSDWTIWSHINPKIIGISINDSIKKSLGNSYDKFIKILDIGAHGKKAKGYYKWINKNGSIDEMYMAVAPILGTPYLIVSTTKIDEFTQRIKKLENDAQEMTKNTRDMHLAIMIGSLIILGLSISIYGYKLTRNIKYLTNAADRISIGELDEKIEIKSNDELGNLAEAISRMQDSLKFSIERLKSKI